MGRETGLAQLANSDSHMLWTIGLCHSEFPGTSPQALRRALEQHQTQPVIGHRSPGFVVSWLKQSLVRLTGLGYWNAQPGAAITLRRLHAVQSN
ncbi:MAG: PHP-associated domain-containing protein [Anaerolineae bacterium]